MEPRPEMTEDLLALGERLYGWNCMPCHGAEGRGDGPVAGRFALQPRDYTRGLFKFKTSGDGEMPFDEDLYRTVTTGVAASGMPSFATFEPAERWALVEWVKSLAVPHFDRFPARTLVRMPPRPGGADAARGAWLFTRCAVCHGGGGRGDGPASGGLVDAIGRPSRVPDMTRGELTFKSGERPEDIFRVLTLGMPGSPMPSFSAIPERDRWDLALHIATCYEPTPEGERLFLCAGCLSCHTVGKGRLIGPDLAGVTGRRPREWLRRWLFDPPRMLQDEAIKAEFKDYPVPMPNLNLSEADIELLLEYLYALPRTNPRH